MENMDKIVELFYIIYEEKIQKENLGDEELREKYHELRECLSDEQSKILHGYDDMEYEMVVCHEKRAIKFVLELLCPMEQWI